MRGAARRWQRGVAPAALVAVVGVSVAACKQARTLFDPAPKSGVAAGVVVELAVPGDLAASFVRTTSTSKRLVVYLPPKCVDGAVSFRGWAVDAAADVSSVALVGEQPCVGTPHTQFGSDIQKLGARVQSAIAAASAAAAIEQVDVVLAGYSQGAARAEDLAQAFPDRFPRVVLIGAPEAPTVSHLGRARAVATMAGEKDRRDLMMVGTQALERAGVGAKFFLLPGAAHGEMGPDGGRVMREAFAWLWSVAP